MTLGWIGVGIRTFNGGGRWRRMWLLGLRRILSIMVAEEEGGGSIGSQVNGLSFFGVPA